MWTSVSPCGKVYDLLNGRRKLVTREDARAQMGVVGLQAGTTTHQCTGARHVIHHMVHQCSPRRPPHSVPVLTLRRISVECMKGVR